ncbi:MAG: hypothetical protein ACHQQP_08435, partial [Gemmatimonadales bacterium]
YVKGLPGSADLRKRLYAVHSVGEVEAIFGEYLSSPFANRNDDTSNVGDDPASDAVAAAA